MKFKEFVSWCNQRACDGCWSLNTAITCIKIVREEPFWRRGKVWKRDFEWFVVDEIVVPIENKIKEVF